jgi:uroporphyrinogen decarboxylase
MEEMTPRERVMTALRGGAPDRVPCFPSIIRWSRYHHGCTCPRHQLSVAQEFGLDAIIQYGSYTWQSTSNDYIYSPAGYYGYAASGLYGDLPNVDIELRVENRREHVWYYRTFHTPAGDLHDVIQWSRPDIGYGDGPNPHRVEPLVKTLADLDALRYLYSPPRRDVLADIPLVLDEIGERAVVAALDCTHAGSWGMEPLGPEQMLIASVTDPELLKGVCRLANDAHLRNLRAMLEMGLEVVYDSWFQCGPSVGWSPTTYRDIFLPLIQEAIDLVHEFGALYIYQDDGKMRDIMPWIVEAGADVISGLEPPDVGDVILKDAKEQFGDRVALLGGLSPVYSFDLGSPEIVREAVRQAIADAGAGGGYMIGAAEAIDPQTSPETMHAAVQAARDFGVYGRDLT